MANNNTQVILLANGQEFNSGDMLQSGSVITVSATTETGTLHVELNKTEVELSGNTYSFNLDDNTYINVYVDDEKPVERYCLDFSTNDNTIITGTTTIGSGTTFNPGYYITSGESVTISANTVEGKDVTLFRNGQPMLWKANNTYTFKITGDTYIQTIYTPTPVSGQTKSNYLVDVQVNGVTDPILTFDGNVELPYDIIIKKKIGNKPYSNVRRGGKLYLSYKGKKVEELNIEDLEELTGNTIDISQYLISGTTNNFKLSVHVNGENGEVYNSTKVVTVKYLTEIPYFKLNNIVNGTLIGGETTLYYTETGEVCSANTISDILSGTSLTISASTEPHYQVAVKKDGSQVTLDSGNTYTFIMDWDKKIETTFNRKSETMYNVNYTVSGQTLDDVIMVTSGIDGVLTPNKISQVSANDKLNIFATTRFDLNRNIEIKINDEDITDEVYEQITCNSGYTITATTAMTISVNFSGDENDFAIMSLEDDYYEAESATSITNVDIPDFSSLAFMNYSDDVLYAASNTTVIKDGYVSGKNAYDGGVYMIYLDDNTTSKHWTIPGKQNQSNGIKSYEDTEALTFDAKGNMYLGFERLQQLAKAKSYLDENEMPACDYDVINTFDFTGKGHKPTASKEVEGYDANEGIEGIEYLSGTTFFVSNQVNPTEVILYNTFNGKKLNSQILPDPVASTEVWKLDNAGTLTDAYWEIADLAYVKSLNELWVMNSERAVIYRYDVNVNGGNGAFLTYKKDIKLGLDNATPSQAGSVTTYTIDANVNSISTANAEALAVDEHNGIIYVGAEGFSGGVAPGILYKFNLSEIKKKDS